MASRLALFALGAFASLVSVSADGLLLKVNGPTQIDDISSLHIKATLTNTGTSALTLVNDPRSALSTTPTDTFSIAHESGAIPDFTGMMVKYSFDLALANGDVTTLNPGQFKDITHSLADAYDFTHSGPGTYEISPSTIFHAVSEAGNPQAIYATLENSHKVSISGSVRLAVPREFGQRKRETPLMKGPIFQGCNQTQQNQIKTAIPAAKSYVSRAISYLEAHAIAWPRFTTWFGKFESSRRAIVYKNFRSLAEDGTEFTSWTYNCSLIGCRKSSVFAYVYPNTYGVVHLCTAFWGAPMTGTNSKAGTVVHEGSHFSATAGTKDFAYGHAACEDLAHLDPTKAIQNADSYEYFAENTPPLQ